MPANIPDLGAVSSVGSQFQHNVFGAASKGFAKISKAAVHTAMHQRAAARNAYYSDVSSTIRAGRQAYNQQARANAQQAAQSARTMQQQRNYAHGQAHAEQRRRDREAAKAANNSAPTTSTSPLTPTFSHPTPQHSPSQGQAPMFSHGPSSGTVRPVTIPQATFSHQFTGAGSQGHTAPPVPTLSHAPTPASQPSTGNVSSAQFGSPGLPQFDQGAINRLAQQHGNP